MTDLEIVKKCAEKMGLNVSDCKTILVPEFCNGHYLQKEYNPLTDDAQAMALVKKFGGCFLVKKNGAAIATMGESAISADNLNRAICECVAKLP